MNFFFQKILRITPFFPLTLLFFLIADNVYAAKPVPVTPCNPGEITLINNYLVTANTVFCKNTYTFTDSEQNGVIIVGTDNIVIDGNNLTLDGKKYVGFGIILNGHKGVTIKNFNIKGFYYAIKVQSGEAITIENNNLSYNKVTDNTFLDINQSLAVTNGGGVLFDSVVGSTIRGNKGQNQDVGANLYYSSTNLIENNDFSANKAWGMRLYQSTGNTLLNNQAHHVNRCRNTGCDSAGILLVNASNGNTVSGNNLTYSGDGFFIGNQYSIPSDNNIIEGNDASYSPNNAFETTFSQGNIFRNNIASYSNYGFWLGYSHHSFVENNIVIGNRTDGINIDRGSFMSFTGNNVKENGRYGIAFTYLTGTRPETSHDHMVIGNQVLDNINSGVYLQDTTAASFDHNLVSGNKYGFYLTGNSTGVSINQNNLLCSSLTGKICQYEIYNNMVIGNDVNGENNWWGTNVENDIKNLIYDQEDDLTKGLIDYNPWLSAPAL